MPEDVMLLYTELRSTLFLIRSDSFRISVGVKTLNHFFGETNDIKAFDFIFAQNSALNFHVATQIGDGLIESH
uniref:Uncharacterized protein n=1 Tax=Romanomermis culicivorax TaxID=13658 RepID=A0A915K7M0_ROMCU